MNFTNGLKKYINKKLSPSIDEKDYGIVHFNICLFLTRPEGTGSQDSVIFKNWILKALTNSKKKLHGLVERYRTKLDDSRFILFSKKLTMRNKITLNYTLSPHYEFEPELLNSSKEAPQFFNRKIQGSNVIVFVVDSENSYTSLQILINSTPENSKRVLHVYNNCESSSIPIKQIQEL